MHRRRHNQRGHGDSGFTLVELLAAVTLLSLATAGTLTALNVSIKASDQQSKHANARRWLISAADYLVSAPATSTGAFDYDASGVERLPCTTNTAAVITANYETAIRSLTASKPSGWADANLSISSDPTFWNGSTFSSTCVETTTNGLGLQQITLSVSSPDAKVTETITVVKRDG